MILNFKPSTFSRIEEVAARRRAKDRQKGWGDQSVSGSHADVVAAVAEFTLRHYLRLSLDLEEASDSPKGWKVGEYTVRGVTTTGTQEPTLRVYKKDRGKIAGVWVDLLGPRAEVMGWMDAAEAQQPQYWTEELRFPCYTVLESELNKLVRPNLDSEYG